MRLVKVVQEMDLIQIPCYEFLHTTKGTSRKRHMENESSEKILISNLRGGVEGNFSMPTCFFPALEKPIKYGSQTLHNKSSQCQVYKYYCIPVHGQLLPGLYKH